MRAFLCSVGSETALTAELARAGADAELLAPGVVASAHEARTVDPVFARQVLPDARLVTGGSVRALAEEIFGAVEAAIDRWPGPFVVHTLAHAEPPPGLASRAALAVREALALLEVRRRRASRRRRTIEEATAALDPTWMVVQILALGRERFAVSAATPRALPMGGLDLARWPGGEAPVAIDREPPSRAYQKLEEALSWMETAPRPGETCVDLGASPGGWTATALKRGARVVAVDRAPLAPPLAGHRDVTTVIGNAFTYTPPAPVDWLLCDVICEPARSLALCERWLTQGLSRQLVVTIKFKGQAGYGLLAELPPLLARVQPAFARVKQLAHNKNEVTVMVRRTALSPAIEK